MRSQRFLQIILGFGQDLDIVYPLLQSYKILKLVKKTFLVTKILKQNIQILQYFQWRIVFNFLKKNTDYINYEVMGSIYNLLSPKVKQHTQMNRANQKYGNNKQNPLIYGRPNTQIPRQISQPKNVKKQVISNQQKNKPTQQIQFSNQQILAKMHCIILQGLDFDQGWIKLQDVLTKYFKFNIVFPQPVNKKGEQLIINGSFIVYWLKIIAKSPCINMSFIYKDVQKRYLPKIQKQKQYLQSYLKYIEQQAKRELPRQDFKQQLKRVTKNSTQRNTFKDQISYDRKPKLTIEQRKKLAIVDKAILIDFFQINDVYLLEEVDIIGVVRQFNNIFCILQVKLKSNQKEITCIGVKSNKKIDNSCLQILEQIQKQFQCLSYLQLDGKDSKQL